VCQAHVDRWEFDWRRYDTTKAVIIDPVLTYSTRLGGTSGVLNAVIAADAAGNVYVSGTTGAFDFPVVNQIPSACQGTCSTSFETVYLTKINAAGTALVHSSLIGGSTLDEGFGIAVDGLGNVYLSGSTSSTDFPRVNPIPGACVGTCGTGAGDAFVTKVSATSSPRSSHKSPQWRIPVSLAAVVSIWGSPWLWTAQAMLISRLELLPLWDNSVTTFRA